MQKKVLLVALSTVFTVTCAHAQKGGGKGEKESSPDSVIELYGKVYPELVFPSSKGATAAGTPVATYAAAPTGENLVVKRTEMESSNSRFGVRGYERLGQDLKAIFQLETQFLIDSNNTAFAQRDSFVGLQHAKFGTVKLGRFDTPFKEYGDDISFLNVSSGNFTSTSTLLRRPGFGTSNNSRFHERAVNAVEYESPDWGPVDFKVMYSTFEADTTSPPRKPRFISAGLKYEAGPFAVMVGHEIHYDRFGLSSNIPTAMRNINDANVRSKDTASEIAFTLKLGAHQFEIDANQKKYDEPGALVTGRARSYKNNGYLAIWDARWTPQWRTQIHYIKGTAGSCERVNAVCTTGGLGGEMYSAGFAYYFSKKTFFFAMISKIKNDYSAMYNNSNQQEISVGEDITQVGVGLHTAF
jgi:predicted porin